MRAPYSTRTQQGTPLARRHVAASRALFSALQGNPPPQAPSPSEPSRAACWTLRSLAASLLVTAYLALEGCAPRVSPSMPQATTHPAIRVQAAPQEATQQPAILPPPPPAAPPGFRFNKDLVCRWSHDLVTWSAPTVLARQCDTPQLAWIYGHPYLLFAGERSQPTDFPLYRAELKGNPAQGYRLAALTSLFIRGDYPHGQTDPSVVALPDGRYRLFYVQPTTLRNSATDPARSTTEVCSAVSDNGIIWAREAGSRMSGAGIVDPEAVCLDTGAFRLYYTLGADNLVHSAHAVDGKTFTPEPGVRMEGCVSSTLRLDDGSYVAVHQGRTTGSAHHRVQISRSRDGLLFEAPTTLNLTAASGSSAHLESPSLLRMQDGTWLLVYLGVPEESPRAAPVRQAKDAASHCRAIAGAPGA